MCKRSRSSTSQTTAHGWNASARQCTRCATFNASAATAALRSHRTNPELHILSVHTIPLPRSHWVKLSFVHQNNNKAPRVYSPKKTSDCFRVASRLIERTCHHSISPRFTSSQHTPQSHLVLQLLITDRQQRQRSIAQAGDRPWESAAMGVKLEY